MTQTKTRNLRSWHQTLLAIALAVAGCGEASAPPETAAAAQPLLGGVRFGGECAPADRRLFQEAAAWGRPVTKSAAFEECIAAKMQNYAPCAGDPFASQPRAVQSQRVLEAARSDNDLRIRCPSSGPDAFAFLDSYGHSKEEELFFLGVLNQARSVAPTDPVLASAILAATIWHEAMHTHGYRHGSTGGGNEAADRLECGVPANLNPWEVVPYLVDRCIADVIFQSSARCGANTCGGNAKRLVSHYNGASCGCVDDPWLGVSSWSPRYADSGATTAAERLSVQYVDIDGDGQDDLCGIEGTSIRCSGSATVGFDAAAAGAWDLRSPGWSVGLASYRGTLAFPDVNRDGLHDVCMRQGDGIYCAVTLRLCVLGVCSLRFAARSRWVAAFGDADGWDTHPSLWETIQFADVDGARGADVCGRGYGGVWCGLSNGATAFAPPRLMADAFSDANGWSGHESYWRTIRIVDVSGDGQADVCGRGAGGIWCGHYDGVFRNFGTIRLRTAQFADPWWRDPQHYKTIAYGDLNGDGAADVCGRGVGGMYCGLYGGANEPLSEFVGVDTISLPEFSDANGWGAPARYTTLRLVDVDGDGKADVCGRGHLGITCARSMSWLLRAFAAPELWVKGFGDNAGWNASDTYYLTVKPARVSRAHPGGSAFCGRGSGGILCSRR